MLAARRILRPVLAASAGASAGALTLAVAAPSPPRAWAAGRGPAHCTIANPICLRTFATNPYPPPNANRGATADLCDVHVPAPVDTVAECPVQIMRAGLFRDYGGRTAFSGRATTIKCFEANPLVRACLEEPGGGRVLVVDGGGSLRCALLGDNIAAMASANAWAGIIIHGCIRDAADIRGMGLGVKALATHPLKSAKRDPGLRDVPVSFGGVTVRPGDWVYADGDGVLVSPAELTL